MHETVEIIVTFLVLFANGLVVYNSTTYVIKRIKHEYDKQRTARDKRPRQRDTK